jgi:hypothetical protein
VRVFDVETGLPITEVLKHNYDVRSATFSPDGHWLVTTVGDAWSAFIWDVPDYPLPVPAWVPELTEALAGQQVDAIGRPHFVSCERVLELKEKLQQAGPRQDAYTRWATWFFASAGVRSLSPNAPGLDKQTVSSAPAQISPAPHDNPGRIGNLSNLNTRISIPGLFNTGVGAGRSLLWENEIDRHYTYASGGVVQARPIAVQAMAGWLKDSDASAWIVPTTERFAPVGDYRYETKFDLSGLDPATAVVSGRWSCDNAGLDILINGRSTGQSNTLEFHAWTPFVISNAFVPGRNILAFLVNNAPFKNGEGNPTGMRVEMSGSAQREIPRSDLPNAPSLAQTVISARLPELPREPNASSTARIAIPGLFNTGVYDGGFPLVHSTLDHHYTYGPGSVGGGSPMAVNACRVWLTNSDGSAWIAPTLETMAPAGDYRYETEFDLSGLDPATAAVSGRWATDNAGSDILINGRSTGQSNTLQINTWTPFIITNGFVAGSNRLTFIVNIASPNGEDNPTGLRVEMSGTARRATPRKLDANTTARAHIHLFNSGEDDSGLRIDFDGTDTHYSYAPGSVASGRPTVITAFEQWLQDSETSTWIAPNAEPIAPVGNYHYQTEFDLVGLDPATAVISGKWATDNAGLDILINGQSTGQTNALEYRAWTPFHITNHFVPGRNTLTFIVTNAPEPPGALNPTGLRVEMSGTAEPLPAPVSQRVQR